MSRYIELNPVRAKMVTHPGEYPWSSYRHNAMGIKIGMLTEHELYKRLGSTYSACLQAYRKLFVEGISVGLLDDIRLCTNKEWVIGHADFIKQIEEAEVRKVYLRQWGRVRRSTR